MAGQGITVSIQAKIEGWQDQIKQIQNAMKNIKPGSDISKGLVKDLQQVNDMVNNLGKNMNQRLTSDSQITGFVDKIMQVEEVFDRLGTSMSHISFGDIKPEYITASFKDLLQTLEQANNALGQGMESSFQNAIANSKTLQKEFERMKIDPKSMNINAIQEALADRGKALEKDVNEGLKKLTDFEKGLEKLKNTRDELAARDAFLGKDANTTVQSLLVGHQLPTKGTILDADELEKQVSFFRSNLLKAGFTPTQLNRIIPDLETVMKAGHWDEMPSKFAEYLREAQNRTQNSLAKASADYKQAILDRRVLVGDQNHLSALRFNNTQAQNEVSNILSGTVQNDTRSLRDIVSNLRQQLEQAVTSGFKGLGSKLFSSSQQGMQDASAAMKDYSAALDQVKAKEQAVNKVQGVVQRYFSIYAAVRMVSKGIRSMMTNIKDLDKTITEIAIVTKMNQNDLWGQMPQYTKLAKQYAASISGVYKVSQLYYQQGLGQQDVMALTEQTLKMARISGLDYAEATDYMTNAVRSFKMEMTEAQTVVDVYSAVAASSASSVTELATAMSKTASSAAAVGSSFENTTAMLAVMIEATRESPENIGSAMKSIISRYGELKENKTGIDEEGEEYSLNKVDKALQTVGISIHDANGEFRDFDDVIFELSEKWNGIDKNTQRYIATVMAGNRQQSRFLALVSSAERLKEESAKAANSEDASQLQFLKTMDSIEAKTQQFQTSLQSLYTSSGLENLYKGLLDFGNEFASTLESISGKQGLVGVISNLGASFVNMATFATTGFSLIKSGFMSTKNTIEHEAKLAGMHVNTQNAQAEYENLINNPVLPIYKTTGKGKKSKTPTNKDAVEQYNAELAAAAKRTKESGQAEQAIIAEQNKRQALLKKQNTQIGLGMAASAAGMALSTWANTMDINKNRTAKGWLTAGGSALSGLGTGLMVGASVGGPIGALVGGLTALPGIIQGLGMLSESVAERVQRLEKNITETSNNMLKSKDDLKTLTDYKKKYTELSKAQYDSAEKAKEFQDLQNEIAEKYPSLISSMTSEGNAILDMSASYEVLLKAKREVYTTDFLQNLGAEIAALQDIDYIMQSIYNKSPRAPEKKLGFIKTDKYDEIYPKMQASLRAQTGINIQAAAAGTVGLGDVGFNQLTGGDLRRMFLKSDEHYFEKLFMGGATQAQSFSDEEYLVRQSAGFRDIASALYSRIVNDIANNDQASFANIQAYSTDEIYDLAIKAASDNTREVMNSNKDAYVQMINDMKQNFSEQDYESLIDIKAGTMYGQDLTDAKIKAKNAAYIQTLNDTYETLTDTETSALQQTAIRQKLDKGLKDFLSSKEYDSYFENENFRYFDENTGQYEKFKKGKDEGKLLEAFYTGTGIFDNQKNAVQLNKNFGMTDTWYSDQIEKYQYLNTDELENIYTSLGENTRKGIAQKLSEDLSVSEQNTYKNLEEWLTTETNREDLAGDEEQVAAAIQRFQEQYGAVGISSERLQQMATTLMILQDAFDEQYEKIGDRYEKWAGELSAGEDAKINQDTANKISDLKNKVGAQYLQGIQDQYKTILKNESLSDNQIESQVSSLTDIFTFISDSLPSDIKNSVIQKMQSADLTSINGIYALIETLSNIEDFDLDTGKGLNLKQKLKDFSKNLRVNVETEINSYFDSMEAASEGFDKALSSATGGMDLKAAKEMSDKIGVSLKEFTVKDGKFFYDNLDKIQEAYTIDAQDRFEELKKNVQTRYQKLSQGSRIETRRGEAEGKDLFSGKFSLSEIKDLFNTEELQQQFSDRFNIDYNEFLNYYEQFKDYQKEGGPLGFVDFIGSQIDDQLAESIEVLQEWQKQTQALSQLKNGKIEGFLKTTGAWKTAWDYEGIIRDQNEAEQQAQKDNEELIQAIAQGDISNLPDNLKQFAKDIYDARHSVISNLTSSMNDIIGGKDNQLFVDDTNIDLLQDLYDQGYLEDVIDTETQTRKATLEKDDIVKLTQDVINGEQSLNSWIQEHYTNGADKLKALQEYNNLIHKNTIETTTNLMDQTSTVTFDEFTNYLNDIKGFDFNKDNVYQDNNEDFTAEFQAQLDKYGLEFNKATGRFFIKRQEQYLRGLKQDIDELGEDATLEERNAAEAKYDAGVQRITTLRTEALNTLFKDYDNISQTDLESIANAFEEDYSDLRDRITEDNGLGGRKLSIKKVQSWLKTERLTEDQIALYEGLIAGIADDYLDNISNAMTNVTKGVTKQADMQSFAEDYTKVTGEKLGAQELFIFDDVLQAFTLKPEYLQKYIQGQKQQLLDAGYTESMVNSYIQSQTMGIAAAAVDIQSYLQSDNQEGQIKEKTKQQLENFKATLTKREENWKSYSDSEEASLTAYEALSEEEKAQYTSYYDYYSKITDKLAEEGRKYNEKWADFQDKSADDLLEIFKNGGDEAVKLASLMAEAEGKELTAEEIQQYYAPMVEKYSNMANQIAELTVGQYIEEGDFRTLLEEAGAVDSTTGLVTASVSEMVSVYQEIYERMADSAKATASQLNSVYAKMLTAQEQGDIDAISVMGDAMGMTYDALGSMLGKYGIELKQWLSDNTSMYEKIGNGKVRITDFTSFADQMGWEAGSEEWTSTFKTYNDGLIEANKKVKDSIEGELKGFAELQPGDWLNLTYTAEALKKFAKSEGKDNTKAIASAKQALQKAIEEQAGSKIGEISAELYQLEQGDLFTQLNNKLQDFNAYLDDGILKLFDDANMLGIAKTLSEYAKITKEELGDSFYEISDVITSILSAYVENMKKGINGTLNNKEMSRLVDQASDMGMNLSEMDFTRTADGLKMSNRQAINMYQKLKQIDSVQSKLVFNDLKSSLEDTNENFKTTTALLAHIGELQRELTSDMALSVDPSSLEDLQNELSLALEINLVNLMTDEADWNFMNQDVLPAGFKNAIEYFTGVSEGVKLLSDAAEEGAVDVSKFATLFNHLEEIAYGTGETFEFLGQTIGPEGSLNFNEVLGKLADLYYIDPSTGKAMISNADLLNEIGLDMALGAEGFSESLTLAIQHYTEKNAQQLKNISEFYGGLGDLKDAIDNAKDINFSELFTADGFDIGSLKETAASTEKGSKEAQNILDNLYKATKNMTVNGKNLSEELEKAEGVLTVGSENYKAVKAIMDVMAIDDWSDPDAYALISSRFADAGFEGKIDLGEVDITVENGGVILHTKTKGQDEYTYNGKKYGTSADAIKALKKDQSDAIEKALNKEGQEEYTIPIEGTNIHVTHNEDGIAITDDGTELAKKLDTLYDNYVEQQKNSSQGYLSKKAWQVEKELIMLPTISDQGGVLTADQKQSFLDAGISNKKQLETFLNDPVRRKNFEAAIGVSLPFEYDGEGKVTPESFDKYSDQVMDMINNSGLTQTISQGVAKAFSEGGASEALSKAIHDGLTESLSSEGTIEIEAPEIVIKPGKITIDTSQSPEANVDGEINVDETNTESELQNKGVKALDNLIGSYQQPKGDEETKTPLATAAGALANTGAVFDAGNIGRGSTNLLSNWTAESLAQEANKLWRDSGLSSTQAADKFKIKTGIDIDPNTVKSEFKAEDFSSYFENLDLTQMATDVMSGITAAFSSPDSAVQISSTISEGFKQAVVDLGGEDTSNIKIPIEIDVEQATESIASIQPTEPVKIPFDAEIGDNIPPEVDPGKGEIIYDGVPPKKAPAAPSGTGTINYSGVIVSTPKVPTLYGTIEYTSKVIDDGAEGVPAATGNVGLATGNARAGGTLMGELGPELVVSKGRYFVVGQSGPEMVNLADDAIVFNHLQTQSLLTKGTSSTRGRAITNEQNAVAFATGSRNGGRAAENGLKQASADFNRKSNGLRQASEAFSSSGKAWHANDNLRQGNVAEETKDAMAGAVEEAKNFIDKLERWYNWLQKIAQLEKEITIEEAKRTRYASDMIPHGKEYFTSQMNSLDALNEQLEVQKDLNKQRKKYFETLREELNQGAFSILYEFDDQFQPKYKEGMYEFMSSLLEADWYKTGAPNNEAKAIYSRLAGMGFESMMQYDSSGNKINKEKEGWENQAVQAFVERYKKGLEEGQKYHDDLLEGEQKVEELIDAKNQILKEIEDNQITVENKVLKAIEDMRQQEIDNLKDEKDAIEKSASTLIDGLNDQLDRERNIYQNQQNVDELNDLQRKLGILQRSGGSASEIADLQSQIQSKQYDNYFEAQELQIQAIQDASDAEIERLDNQITLMEETLSYEKENGLLWAQVNEILTTKTPREIADFIQTNTKEYWSKSLTELNQQVREDIFEIERFKEFSNTYDGMQVLIDMYGEEAAQKRAEKKKKEEEAAEAEKKKAPVSRPSGVQQSHGGGGGGGYTGNGNNPNKNTKAGKIWTVYDDRGIETNYTFDADTKEEAEKLLKEKFGEGTYLHIGSETTEEDKNKKAAKRAEYEQIGTTNQNTKQIYKPSENAPNVTSNMNDPHTVGDTFYKGNQMYEVQKDGSWKAVKKQTENLVKKQASGGYAKHGIYELGERGTETVFTAEQTQVLRNNILSNRPDSLINLLKSYNEAYRGLPQNAYDSISNMTSEIITIERAEVNLQIEKLADDYDSRRAANTVMDEMLRIAAKTRANNSVRR